MKITNEPKLHIANYILPNPKANILLVHGLGEHSGRYIHVAKALNAIGLSVYSFDLRGHGKSEGEQCFINTVDEYRQDLENIYLQIPKDIPFFILGHSMGGLIVTQFLLFRERTGISGVILSGAALEIGEDITPTTIKILSVVARFAPKLKTVKLDPKSISRDKNTVESYINDPLVYAGGTKAGLGLAMLKAIEECKAKFQQFDYPVLIMHGEKDSLTNPEGSKELYAKCKSKDKTLKIWDGALHEIFNEINKEEVLSFTTDWLQKHV